MDKNLDLDYNSDLLQILSWRKAIKNMSVVNAKSLDGAAVLWLLHGIAECINIAFYHIYLAIISNYI